MLWYGACTVQAEQRCNEERHKRRWRMKKKVARWDAPAAAAAAASSSSSSSTLEYHPRRLKAAALAREGQLQQL
eukprot:20496-Heterococcus_DN1.PRE.2